MVANKNEFFWETRVYYEDTDAGGIVYHANYLNFMERARTEWLRALGIEQTELLQQSIGLVVTSLEIKYLAAAKFNEMLRICSQLVELKRASVEFEQKIYNNDNNKLLVSAQVRVACVDLSKMRPRAIPEFILGELSRVV
ncbi:tol-pal system-associated acyl-CoA thioesterase [Paraneptunicella aestuarii]|uniref:tol-pal system-associated acyl-CoA thioesterase n=1 Tax=Paraneptunicella aestuarii TaxID=2831148 RepID=UPI001E601C1E|nr:tol-pal system-associated acyl-CoA thioesterase [Paraneptunicella aestuarii]UAA37323.1 tol-pal system-associated acyl-CoA thioesterase [Paraneptunicella aestuarii]